MDSNLKIRVRTVTDWILLAGFCAFLFFYGLGSFGLIGADEPRYAQVAREMLAKHGVPILFSRVIFSENGKRRKS